MRRTPAQWARAILDLPRPLLLAFDVDGTLAPIVPKAHAARVPKSVLSAIERLDDMRGVRVALITGRDAKQLAGIVPDDRYYRAVSHGKRVLKPRQAPGPLRLTAAERRSLEAFGRAIAPLASEGADVEQKEGAFGVHTRRLERRNPALAGSVLRRARALAREHGLHAREGRCVVEVEARAGDKGGALRRIQSLSRSRGLFYAGDDVTDVPALQHAVAEGGVGLFVRSPERPRAPRGMSGSLSSIELIPSLLDSLLDQN